jgi:hypothetical protein
MLSLGLHSNRLTDKFTEPGKLANMINNACPIAWRTFAKTEASIIEASAAFRPKVITSRIVRKYSLAVRSQPEG